MAAGALAGALALALYAGLAGPPLAVVTFLGGAAILALGLGIVLHQAMLVTGGIAMLGCQFILSLYAREATASVTAAGYGAALLLVAELAHWSLDLGAPHRGGAAVLRRRAWATALLVAAALAASLIAAALSQASLPGSVALTALGVGGVLAGIVLVAVVLWAGHRSPDGGTS